MAVARWTRTPADRRHRISPRLADAPGRVRRAAKDAYSAGHERCLVPQVGQVSSSVVDAAAQDQPLRVIDQVEVVRRLLAEALTGTENVARFILQPDQDSVGGEVFLTDFSQTSRFEIYQIESSIRDAFPAVSLELVVRPAL